MNFKQIDSKYRPIPFWSWNERLNIEETIRQIEEMYNVGIGGFFMHARGGLQTEYLGKEWFDNVTVSVETAKKYNMGAWAYDENGWPSGFGNGKVNGKGEKFQQKYLRIEKGEKQTPYTLANYDGYHFYYEINPFYVDTLDDEATKDFISEIYEPYYAKYKNDLKGFFTDEPQISRNGIPWSFKIPAAYKRAYGEDIIPRLKELFFAEGNYKNTRIKFWKLITDMFSANFMKPIYDWCVERGLDFTGHFALEEYLHYQLTANGAVMPHYEYFTIPGMDWLGRPIFDSLNQHQLSSAAQQLGKKQILSETFALCGHSIGFEDLRRIYEWQMIRGVNLLCQHLEGYSLRGIRKRDYPPAMNYQQPWWHEYKIFNDAMSRIGMIMAEGKVHFDTLLIHPMTTAWTLYDDGKNEGLVELNDEFLKTIKSFEEKHVLFHLGDETIMERHAHVDGDKLIIGEQVYTTVVMMPDMHLLENTKRLLAEYKENGGKVIFPDELETNDIVDNKNITYTKREFDGFDVHYFVNSTDEKQSAHIKSGAKAIDIVTGDTKPFDGYYEFEPCDSLLVIDDGSERLENKEKNEISALSLEGTWEIKEQTENVLTLDFCDYYFDDKLQEKNGYVLNIQNRACVLECPVKIRQEYRVNSEFVPKNINLVVETPEIFKIWVNGQKIDKNDKGYFIDKMFRKISIEKYFKCGENIIIFECDFKQSATVYENIKKGKIFESEKNKLTYDMEIEPIYLIGDFSVGICGNIENLDKNAIRANGFKIYPPKESITLSNIEQQGYAFFAGQIKVEKKFDVADTNKKISFNKKGINIVKVSVNGKSAGTVAWNPTELDLSEILKEGENTISLTIINNLRNMMGPHHRTEGECYLVTPESFFKENCIWKNDDKDTFTHDYCFTEVGLV